MFTPEQIKQAAKCPTTCSVSAIYDRDQDLLVIHHYGAGFNREVAIPIQHHIGKGRERGSGRERQNMTAGDFLDGIAPWLREAHL